MKINIFLVVVLLFLFGKETFGQEGTSNFISSLNNNGEDDTIAIVLFNSNDVANNWHSYLAIQKEGFILALKMARMPIWA